MKNYTGLYEYVYDATDDNLYLINAIDDTVRGMKTGESRKLDWAGKVFTIKLMGVIELSRPINDGFAYYENTMEIYDIQNGRDIE